MAANITPDLTSLAEAITTHAKIITATLQDAQKPALSFAADSPAVYPDGPGFENLQQARRALIEASRAIYDLALGPAEWLRLTALEPKYDVATLGIVSHFDFAKAVPLTGDISFADLSKALSLPEDRVKRIILYTVTNHLFRLSRPGYVAHTATSALLASPETRHLKGWVDHNIVDGSRMSAKFIEFMEKHPTSEERGDAPMPMALGTKNGWFEIVEEYPEMLQRQTDAMAGLALSDPFSTKRIVRGYDWSQFGTGTLVDVGGAAGHIGIAVLESNPGLRLVVQDIADCSAEFNKFAISADVQDRAKFQLHNFFTPEPLCADAYMLKWILHDWSDKYAAKILQNLVPALRPGIKVLLIESVMPPPGVVPSTIEREMRSLDLQMWGAHNSKERTAEDWKTLIEAADSKLKLASIVELPGSAWSVIEVMLK